MAIQSRTHDRAPGFVANPFLDLFPGISLKEIFEHGQSTKRLALYSTLIIIVRDKHGLASEPEC